MIMSVIDDPWIGRLREINQSASLSYLYPSARNSRFTHVLGVASLGIQTLRLLWERADTSNQQTISGWAEGFALALVCHDIGHIAPGSHGAYRVLFPNHTDEHEALACRVLRSNTSLVRRIIGTYGHLHGLRIIEQACALISEDYSRAPRFLIQLLSGGAWNVDRGDWVVRDLYSMNRTDNLPVNSIIQVSLSITPQGSLAIDEAALEALEAFAMARSRLYWNAFNSPICRGFDHLTWAVAACARDQDNCQADLTHLMRRIFLRKSPLDVALDDLFQLREHQWQCQRDIWCQSTSAELRFLAQSLRDGRAPQAISIPNDSDPEQIQSLARGLVEKLGFTGKYHVGLVQRSDGMENDLKNALDVRLPQGDLARLSDYSSYFRGMTRSARLPRSNYLVLPGDVVPDFHRAVNTHRQSKEPGEISTMRKEL